MGYHDDPVIQSVNKLGETIGRGQAAQGAQALNYAREDIQLARDAQEAPVRELKAAEATDALARRKAGVRVLDVFPDEWSLELATWQPEKDGKVQKGEPTLLKKFGDMMGAKVNTEKGHPDYGFFVKEDGKRLSQAEVNNAAPQVEALFIANMGIGRTIRTGKEKIEQQMQQVQAGMKSGQISPEEADMQLGELQSAYDELDAKGANPKAKIAAMEKQKQFLSQFGGAEIEKGIKRLEASIADQEKLLESEKDRGLKTVLQKEDIDARRDMQAADIQSRESIASAGLTKDVEVMKMKIDADKEITEKQLSAESFKNLPAEAQLAHWYAKELNNNKKDGAPDVSPAEAWESIQASKNFKAAVAAYNNFIESNWVNDKEAMAGIEKKARKMFLDNLEPKSQRNKKDWRDVQKTLEEGASATDHAE